MMRLAQCFVIIALSVWWAAPTRAANKFALVVGNNTYAHLGDRGQLQRAVDDARSVADALSTLGFEIVRGENVGRSQFNDLWQSLLNRTQPGDTVVFYFSGHGVELEGANYLLPSDIPWVSPDRQQQLKREAMSVSEFLLDLRRRTPQVSVIILDACRDNPFAPATFRSASHRGGLARMDAPEGTFIMYSAGAGESALDRLPVNDPDRTNSVFTRTLLPLLTEPGIPLPELARRVRRDVRSLAQRANHIQTPAYYDGVIGQFCLAGCAQTPPPEMRPEHSPDKLAWLRASGSDRMSDYQAYMKAWPTGAHSADARSRIDTLATLQREWASLQKSRDFGALRTYVDRAGGTQFVVAAAKRLSELEAIESVQWEQARHKNTIGEYASFIAAWPAGNYIGEASDLKAHLEAIKREWVPLSKSTSIPSLEAFISAYGWSEFGAAATARLVALRRETRTPGKSELRVLTADDITRLFDGAEMLFEASGEVLTIVRTKLPGYRQRLGKDFLRGMLKEDMAAEGSFTARTSGPSARSSEGIAGIVKSRVDGTGSVFLLQMHGSERTPADVDKADRKFRTFQVVSDKFGYVCIATAWHSVLAGGTPLKSPERCKVLPVPKAQNQ